jgi:peptide/nickel transport system permease protein
MAVFVLWGVATLCFLLTHIDALNSPLNRLKEVWPLTTPSLRRTVQDYLKKDLSKDFQMGMGDPARIMLGQHGDVNTVEAIRAELGLDEPLWKQYGKFLGGLLTGDLGTSYKTRKPTLELILDRLPNTAALALAAMFLATLLGVTAGIAAAVWQDSWIDRAAMSGAILGLSAPIYLVGLVLILLFVKKFSWIQGVGMDQSLASILQIHFPGLLVEMRLPTYLLLPALALGFRPASNLARMTRSSMLEVIRQDYIRTARAKGLTEMRVILVHALKNALIPVVTVLGLEMASLLTGAVLTESVFAWPGLGRLTVQALRDLDLPLIQASVIFIALFFVVANLVVDLSYALLDPRVRLQ